MKFGEHIYDSVLERVPHGSTELAEVRHCGFTLPKRLRVFFRYDRSLLDTLFKAAASAVQAALGSDTQSPGLVLTVQTAGEAHSKKYHLLLGYLQCPLWRTVQVLSKAYAVVAW